MARSHLTASVTSPLGVASVRLNRIAVPLIHSHRAAHGSEAVREVILIEVSGADGVTGWGECSTLSTSGYATETTEQAWRSLTTSIVPGLLAADEKRARRYDPAIPVERDGGAVPAALAAARDAFLDLDLRRRRVSLTEHLGGGGRPLPRCVVLAAVGESPEQIAARAADAVASGAAMVKVKISPGLDRQVVGAVREAVSDSTVAVALDANGSYSDPADLDWLSGMEVAYIEQPFAPTLSAERLGLLASRLDVPVALDESVNSLGDIETMSRSGAGRFLSIKPLRLGGAENALRAARRATDLGMTVFVGGMLETGVGRSAALAVASAVAAVTGSPLPTDLGPSSSYFQEDLCEPIECEGDGRIGPPEGIGSGRTPDAAKIERYLVERTEFTA